jgi:hypothetical protein
VPTLGDKGMSTLSDAGSRFVVCARPHIHQPTSDEPRKAQTHTLTHTHTLD